MSISPCFSQPESKRALRLGGAFYTRGTTFAHHGPKGEKLGEKSLDRKQTFKERNIRINPSPRYPAQSRIYSSRLRPRARHLLHERSLGDSVPALSTMPCTSKSKLPS